MSHNGRYYIHKFDDVIRPRTECVCNHLERRKKQFQNTCLLLSFFKSSLFWPTDNVKPYKNSNSARSPIVFPSSSFHVRWSFVWHLSLLWKTEVPQPQLFFGYKWKWKKKQTNDTRKIWQQFDYFGAGFYLSLQLYIIVMCACTSCACVCVWPHLQI